MHVHSDVCSEEYFDAPSEAQEEEEEAEDEEFYDANESNEEGEYEYEYEQAYPMFLEELTNSTQDFRNENELIATIAQQMPEDQGIT